MITIPTIWCNVSPRRPPPSRQIPFCHSFRTAHAVCVLQLSTQSPLPCSVVGTSCCCPLPARTTPTGCPYGTCFVRHQPVSCNNLPYITQSAFYGEGNAVVNCCARLVQDPAPEVCRIISHRWPTSYNLRSDVASSRHCARGSHSCRSVLSTPAACCRTSWPCCPTARRCRRLTRVPWATRRGRYCSMRGSSMHWMKPPCCRFVVIVVAL